MSTVLTNGIIIPDNGNRNWGGDLANNWNIIDLNVGYMTDVKNRVTTLETTVAENTANIQTNASNISALQTSKQDAIEDLETIRAGASAGATAVQPSVLSNYVDLSSEQTINGAKTFTSMLTSSATVALLGASTDKYMAIQSGGIWDNGARISLYSKEHTENSGQFEIVAFNNENKANAFRFSSDGVIPISIGGTLNLGTSTNKWKTFNGLNPGALSLPSDASVTIDTTSFEWGKNFTFTSAVNGHLFINISFSTGTRSLSLKTSRGEYYITNQQGIMRFTMPVYENKEVTILITSSITETVIPTLTLFPCQGNV